ncbi:hypothetical protein [Pseudomonas sp. R5(2019)]|uniref:hypothetical protein n=1 Tax=Pseudomonas sp. R5(2019) TaxID=2697566 RepID=UPI0014126C5A|nr:hypothetical protein [Pseudomonas sp. R5(2019)]NBA93759.1 hypothetical protein [Pseudomonas sp. R5(2019)]
MAKVQILAGDFLCGDGEYDDGVFKIETPLFPWPGLKIPTSWIESIKTMEDKGSDPIDTALTLGLAGGLVLGPLGAMAGFLFPDDDAQVTFIVTLKDGRKLTLLSDGDTYQQIKQPLLRKHPAADRHAG